MNKKLITEMFVKVFYSVFTLYSKYCDKTFRIDTVPCNYNMELAGSHPTVFLIWSC